MGSAGAGGTYRGALDLYLEPNDAQGTCSATVVLRNVSGVRQGEARLRLSWLGGDGRVLADQWLRMDPTEVDQADGKNLALPASCSGIAGARVRSAVWQLGWDPREQRPVGIGEVDGTTWRFDWDAGSGLWVGVTDR